MTGWPSTLTSFSNPVPTDRLNSPSHSSVETAQNTALTELQTFVGVNTGATASAVGTILYDVRSAASDGGGHIQAANKGGTGQTSYTKGDILVAANPSTLSKVAVGSDNQILAVNSSTATGVNWVNGPANKIYSNASLVHASAIGEYSVFSTTVAGSTLGTSNAIRTTMELQSLAIEARCSVLTTAFYGGQPVASIMLYPSENIAGATGDIVHTIISNNSNTSQRHIMSLGFDAYSNNSGVVGQGNMAGGFGQSNPSVQALRARVYGVSSINSTANQTLGTTIRLYSGNASSVVVAGTVVEKIN